MGPVVTGVAIGAALALLEATASTVSLKWAFHRSCFNRVWMGGVAVRLLVLVLVAFSFSRQSFISLVALLTTLVIANTAFAVIEAAVFLKH